MAQATFQHAIGIGCFKQGADYYTVQSAATADSWAGYIGQLDSVSPEASRYKVYRRFVGFDTSGLPDNALIQSAYITLKITYDYSTTDFDIIIKNGQPTYPHDSPVLEDFDISHYSDNGGSINTSGISSLFEIDLNSVGLGWINKTGITKFALISSRDVNITPPTGEERIAISSTAGDITLTVVYFEPTGIPGVGTINLACEDRQSTTLTAVGEVTDIGGGYTYRGFEYYEHGASDEYDPSMWAVREIGRFVAPGEFRMTLYGLKPSTVYYIRAFAGNIFGISYGDWVECSTTTVPTQSSGFTTAKYRLYVSDDEAIAWRGYKGPYTGKQNRIYITDIINKTKGVKILKIDLPEANAKGNFHVCITVQQYLKS